MKQEEGFSEEEDEENIPTSKLEFWHITGI